VRKVVCANFDVHILARYALLCGVVAARPVVLRVALNRVGKIVFQRDDRLHDLLVASVLLQAPGVRAAVRTSDQRVLARRLDVAALFAGRSYE
jgi:hypothetical protein